MYAQFLLAMCGFEEKNFIVVVVSDVFAVCLFNEKASKIDPIKCNRIYRRLQQIEREKNHHNNNNKQDMNEFRDANNISEMRMISILSAISRKNATQLIYIISLLMLSFCEARIVKCDVWFHIVFFSGSVVSSIFLLHLHNKE